MIRRTTLVFALFAAMLPATAVAATSFTDVPADHPFYTDITWLAAERITKGCNPPANDQYCPDDPVTRGQMAAFLTRALTLTNPGTVTFTDDDGSVFEDSIEALGAAGITRGCNPPTNDRFCPHSAVTRAEMAAFLSRALGLTARAGNPFSDDEGSVFEADIERLAVAGITRGCNPPANTLYCPDDPVTRGQMAAFLHRALIATSPDSDIIPESRRTEWDPGLPGGIPAGSVTTSVLDHGAARDGTTDDLDAFAAAISALPEEGGVVSIPAGTYRIDGTVELADGVVLRGAGSDQTHLEFDLGGAGVPAIDAVTYERGSWTAMTDGLGKGTTTVTVADASEVTVPGFAEIQQDNEPTLMYTDPAWDVSWADESVGEMVRVVAVSGNQVTLAEPLHHSYDPAMNPVLRPLGLVEYAGVEDLHITRLDAGDGPTIAFKNSAYVWVKGVASEMTYRSHVGTSSVYRCEIRDSHFIDAHDHGGGGHGYGAALGRHTTGCLVENNIFESLRHSMIIQVGAAGNVYSYNFSRDSHDNNGNLLPDISLHGHYPAMNLFEGNIVEEIGFSDWWGPVGPGNTALRNCVLEEGVFVRDYSHRQNLVGNVLLGDPDEIDVHSSVTGTLAHGNYEAGAIVWDPDITSRDIPASLYLDAAPSFYGSAPWPSTGPDISPMCSNPARERWLATP
jgi:hypothetical protein